MNENIDLAKILKDCPKGTKLYSTIYGVVEFDEIDEFDRTYSISFKVDAYLSSTVTSDGRYNEEYDGECTLFPSKDQRDWSKFTAPWYKKERFDPKTLKPFEKVLIWKDLIWIPTLFTFLNFSPDYPRMRYDSLAAKVIPYNDKTKHLVGTTGEAPEFYRYWEE